MLKGGCVWAWHNCSLCVYVYVWIVIHMVEQDMQDWQYFLDLSNHLFILWINYANIVQWLIKLARTACGVWTSCSPNMG